MTLDTLGLFSLAALSIFAACFTRRIMKLPWIVICAWCIVMGFAHLGFVNKDLRSAYGSVAGVKGARNIDEALAYLDEAKKSINRCDAEFDPEIAKWRADIEAQSRNLRDARSKDADTQRSALETSQEALTEYVGCSNGGGYYPKLSTEALTFPHQKATRWIWNWTGGLIALAFGLQCLWFAANARALYRLSSIQEHRELRLLRQCG